MRPERIHLKTRKGPITDLNRKRTMAVTASLIAATGFKPRAARRQNAIDSEGRANG